MTILLIALVVIAVLAYRSYRRTQLQNRRQHEITAADLDEAIAIAARIPGASRGTVEIRPLVELTGLPGE